jgi:septal ring-binding cell division protein DamX
MSAARIDWSDGKYSTTRGFVKRLELFTINYSTTRHDPSPWILRTTLPARIPGSGQYATVQEAKDAARAFLDIFIRTISD